MKRDISIIIPNWNGRELLCRNLPFVISASEGAEIIVVDDGSTDDSCVYVQATYPGIRLLKKSTHEGYSSSVNYGVCEAKGKVIILLNTDVAPQKNFLKPLVAHFKNPKVFAVGALERSHEEGQIILRGRGIGRWQKGYFIHSRGDIHNHSTAWVSGGSGAFSKIIWCKLGGMDPLFDPFYWEDIDLSYRARKSGYSILFEPKSIVDHYHEEGKIKVSFTKEEIKTFAYRNQYIFHWKNITDNYILIEHIIWTPIRLIQAIFRNDICMIKGFFMAIRKFSQIRKQRNKLKLISMLKDSQVTL